jgi:sorting nexin-9/18/33
MSGLSSSSSFASLLSPNTLGTVSVERRFSHFVALDAALQRLLPLCALPVLPARRYLGRLSDDFVERRRRDLERWLDRLLRHPLARQSETLQLFLSCADDEVRAKLFAHSIW